MSIFNILKKNALLHPNKIALIHEEKKFTYNEFYHLIIQTILNFQKNNFNDKSIVLLIEDNTLSHILSLFALSYLNSTVIPLGTYYSNNHIKKIIKLMNPNCLIGEKKYCFYFKKNSNIKNFISSQKTKYFSYFFSKNKNRLFLKNKNNNKKNFIITFSSGSTSDPKPIVYSQETKIIRFKLFKKLYKINKSDTIIVTSPIDHSLGMRTLYLPFLTGCTCVLMRKFNINLYCEYIKNYNVTFSVLVGNQIYELTKNNKLFKNFFLSKGLISASTKLFNNTKNKILKKRINLYEMYGAAEIGTVTSINLLKEKKKIKSVGKSYNKNIIIKIISEKNQIQKINKPGEIVCKTPGKFKFYLNSKKLNSNSFYKDYFKTGDIGYLDKDNYLYFLSRKKNIIRRSGLTIYPEDIENVILQNKNVEEAAVVSKESKKGEEIYLFVKKNLYVNETYIKSICLKKLSTFQLPNKIIMLKKFPKTNLGKINKIKLAKLID